MSVSEIPCKHLLTINHQPWVAGVGYWQSLAVVATAACSLHGKHWLVSKHSWTSSRAVFKLEKVRLKLESLNKVGVLTCCLVGLDAFAVFLCVVTGACSHVWVEQHGSAKYLNKNLASAVIWISSPDVFSTCSWLRPWKCCLIWMKCIVKQGCAPISSVPFLFVV